MARILGPMITKPRRPTDGARALRAWLEAKGQSLTAFCAEHRLERVNAQRAVNGERKRVSVDFALAVERATRGGVLCSQWASETKAETSKAVG